MIGTYAKGGFVCFALLLAFSGPGHAQNNPFSTNQSHSCTRQPREYDGFKVVAVRIDSPLGWLFPSVTQKLAETLADPGMPLKQGDVFNRDNFFSGFIFLTRHFPELQVNPFNRFAVRLASPMLANCDEQQRTLEAVYRVYHLGVPDLLTGDFERREEEQSARAVAETAATKRLANYFPQPGLGYNRSRSLFGGTKLTINQPGDVFDKLALEATGSASSLVERAELRGSRDFAAGALRQAEWRVAHRYSDVPSDAVQLKESATIGQFAAATRALGTTDLILRFGGSVEGGHQQTDAAPPQLLPSDLARTGYAAGKFFAGGTLRLGTQLHSQPLELRLKASYGLQLGNTGEERLVDYVKQLFDSAAELRYRLRDHRPLSLQTQLTVGSINTLGKLPAHERFFGGNVEENFIAGESWLIRSQPFIRSFPQNRLALVNQNGVVGGDSFFAVNVTLAATVWSRPLVPAVILDDPALNDQIEFQLGTAESALFNATLAKSPELRQLSQQALQLATPLNQVQQKLEALQQAAQESGTQEPGPALIRQLATCRNELNRVNTSLTNITQKLAKDALSTADLRTLVVGFPGTAIVSRIERLNRALDGLAALPNLPTVGVIAEEINPLPALRATLETARASIARAFTEQLDDPNSPVVRAAKQAAVREMRYPRRVLDELLHEANLVGVSPVLLFDAAQLRQRHTAAGETRYALGGGARLSIVSFDVTVGYAWNLHPKPWEGRGALVFTMAVSNLFR